MLRIYTANAVIWVNYSETPNGPYVYLGGFQFYNDSNILIGKLTPTKRYIFNINLDKIEMNYLAIGVAEFIGEEDNKKIRV